MIIETDYSSGNKPPLRQNKVIILFTGIAAVGKMKIMNFVSYNVNFCITSSRMSFCEFSYNLYTAGCFLCHPRWPGVSFSYLIVEKFLIIPWGLENYLEFGKITDFVSLYMFEVWITFRTKRRGNLLDNSRWLQFKILESAVNNHGNLFLKSVILLMFSLFLRAPTYTCN